VTESLVLGFESIEMIFEAHRAAVCKGEVLLQMIRPISSTTSSLQRLAFCICYQSINWEARNG
jgi:hypothetical protein